jgi:hypothetical protein
MATPDEGGLKRPRRRDIPAIIFAGVLFFIGAPILFATAALTGADWILVAGMATIVAATVITARKLSTDHDQEHSRA